MHRVALCVTRRRALCTAAGSGPVNMNVTQTSCAFDTHVLYKRLKTAGFDDTQADSVIECLAEASVRTELKTVNGYKQIAHEQQQTSEHQVLLLRRELENHVATVRDELKSLQWNKHLAIENEMDTLQTTLDNGFTKVMHDITMVDDRRNASRKQLDENFNYKLADLENKLIRWSLGFGGSLALVFVGVMRLVSTSPSPTGVPVHTEEQGASA